MKKRWGKSLLVLFMAVILMVGASGCTEKYYHGERSVIAISEKEQENFRPTVESINTILMNRQLTFEALRLRMGDKALEEDLKQVEEGFQTWKKICEEYGEVKKAEVKSVFYYCYQYAASVNFTFDKAVISADMIFTGDKKLRYMDFFVSGETVEAQYVLPEGLVEEKLTIGEGTAYPLGATLTYPEGGENLPAVLLVQGVGASDRDLSALSTHMFRDLANGLAAQGVAVLRFDTRMNKYPKAADMLKMETLLVDFQRIDDIVLAADLLRQQPVVNPECLYMIGHNLGAILAPRIDEQVGFTGFCMLAAPSHPWYECAYDQSMGYGLDGVENENVAFIRARLESDLEQIQNIDSLEEDQLLSILLNDYACFWKDLNRYDYISMIAESEKPLLLLQGGADYQIVPEKEYTHWQELLNGKNNVSMKLYEGLNHLMMKPEGPYTNVSLQYSRPLTVSQEVIDDIASWILS